MMRCDKCGKDIRGYGHLFDGCGAYLEYHAECCPGSFDGEPCYRCEEEAEEPARQAERWALVVAGEPVPP